ncbi:suppressor of fused domain protein, partial [Pseudomonas syringae pv. actinidiae]|nr:suppressor of fused domain protein [Pseudomonas syringae pv. actinidiae]
MKKPPSPQLKTVAKHILKFFGGTPTVHAYYDDSRVRSMSIVTTFDTIEPGIKSIGTIGLSEIPLVDEDGTEFITRIELCSAAPTIFEAWENVIASAAFFIEQRRKPVVPGAVLENVVNQYFPKTKMPHL